MSDGMSIDVRGPPCFLRSARLAIAPEEMRETTAFSGFLRRITSYAIFLNMQPGFRGSWPSDGERLAANKHRYKALPYGRTTEGRATSGMLFPLAVR